MLFGNRKPRPALARRRGVFRPRTEGLETRALMAVVDLGGTSPPLDPVIATKPYGVGLAGGDPAEGDGFSVTDVGDLLGTGYDDFVIGGPGVQNLNGVPTPSGGTAMAYLVFGSRTTTGPAISDWLKIQTTPTSQRLGDLTQLGNAASGQFDPITGLATFPFDGVKFITSQESGSQLGVSVAPAGIINGVRAFLIGAPGALDDGTVTGDNGTPGNAGTGRAYLVYGGTALDQITNHVIDLDTTGTYGGVNIVTFENNAARSQTGYSVAGLGEVYTDAVNNDIAIGAPLASLNGLGSSGAVYFLPASSIPTTTATVSLQKVGQSGGITGAVFVGGAAGDEAGYSVADAGNVNGNLTSANVSIDDFLIGAPQQTTGDGEAYLVYGSPTLFSEASTTNGFTSIQLASVGVTTASPLVPGLVVQGTAAGDETGWSVSSAGDFNGDGLADFLVGSPGYLGDEGRADLFYGESVSAGELSGTVTLGALPSTVTGAAFIGTTAGDLAGFSVGYTGKILSSEPNPILIGSPGYNADSGTAYLIPGNISLQGTFNLRNANSQPVAATQFELSTPGVSTPAFFGASVGGAIIVTGQTVTADADTIADFIIGAPGYTATTVGHTFAGGAFIEEGAFVPLQTPTVSGVTSTIGIDAPTGPFSINATSPTTLTIYVFSTKVNGIAFDPFLDINPATVTVNGVAFPNATITKDPVDENGDGIEDAIITVTPRSSIGLTTATTTITLRAKLLASSPFPNENYVGQAAVTVSGGSSGGGGGSGGGGTGGASSGVPAGKIVETQFLSHFGPTQYVPTIQALSQDSSYKPIPLKVAIKQYLPQPGFAQRIYNYYYPPKHQKVKGSSGRETTGHRTTTLSNQVFTRSAYKKGVPKTFTHKVKVVPSNLQTERVGYYTK